MSEQMDKITLLATGDILVMRDDPDSMFAHARTILATGDIVFGQLETAYSDRGSRGSSGPRGAVAKDAANRPALARAGFNGMSVASNHTGDWGADALLDCIDRLKADGIQPAGAGKNIEEARRPVVFEQAGRKIAILAYCSVAPEGYYAASAKPGCAPMRAVTHYEPFEYDQPGTPAHILTFPVKSDLDALCEDVRKAKQQADFVFVSLHWGIHGLSGMLADYQQVVGHAIIDAGADGILGHHPHVLKGIEVYRGKVIFYSLGNFAMEKTSPKMLATANMDWLAKAAAFYGQFQKVPKNGAFGLTERHTMIGRVEILADGSMEASFVPCIINENNEPVPVEPDSPEGREVIAFVRQVTDEGNLNGRYEVRGGSVYIQADAGAGQGAGSPVHETA